MKICPLEKDRFHTDRGEDVQTDMTKLINSFRYSATHVEEHLERQFQRCEKSRNLSLIQRSSIRQTSTAVNDVICFDKPY